jgi:tRNA threonylcarbamoyladenosine biosynthesis protein TsaE
MKAAAEFSRTLRGGEVLALYGDLGAGKTVFAKGIARGLGIADEVTSPTFIVMNEYGGGRLRLCHYDMYRADGENARNLGLHENFGRPDTVCVVEWPDNVGALLPKTAIKIRLSGDGRARTIARE